MLFMLIFADFTPKVKHDDTFWYPVSPAIDKNFVQDQFFGHGCGLRVNDLYVAIVRLHWLHNINRGNILLWDTPLRLLHEGTEDHVQDVATTDRHLQEPGLRDLDTSTSFHMKACT